MEINTLHSYMYVILMECVNLNLQHLVTWSIMRTLNLTKLEEVLIDKGLSVILLEDRWLLILIHKP